MNTGFVLLLGLVLTAALLLSQLKTRISRKRVRARQPLTKHEQAMYFRLRATFPEHVVLAQVAFSALLTARGYSSRNRFSQKTADFVLCTRAFDVLAVIELDDSTHRRKRTSDAARDALLGEAGYAVLRFTRIPDASDLLAALATMRTPQTPQHAEVRAHTTSGR